MKQRVLLIQPPRLASQPNRMVFPRGLAQIGSFLRANGWPVAVLPLSYAAVADVTPPAVIRSIIESVLAEYKPDVVGVGCPYTIGYHTSIEMLRLVKAFREDVVTVIGGPHVTFTDAETAADPAVDCVVRGEGEWTMAEWLAAREAGRDPAGVRGPRSGSDGATVRTPKRPRRPGRPRRRWTSATSAEFIQRCQVYGMIHRGCCGYRCALRRSRVLGQGRQPRWSAAGGEIRPGSLQRPDDGHRGQLPVLASPELARLIRGSRGRARALAAGVLHEPDGGAPGRGEAGRPWRRCARRASAPSGSASRTRPRRRAGGHGQEAPWSRTIAMLWPAWTTIS